MCATFSSLLGILLLVVIPAASSGCISLATLSGNLGVASPLLRHHNNLLALLVLVLVLIGSGSRCCVHNAIKTVTQFTRSIAKHTEYTENNIRKFCNNITHVFLLVHLLLGSGTTLGFHRLVAIVATSLAVAFTSS